MSGPQRTGRLAGKVALVAGAGQTPGDTIGNGRATAVLFARQGALVASVDRSLASAAETCELIAEEGGDAFALQADVRVEAEVAAAVAAVLERCGRVDVLHNNVGIGSGDNTALDLDQRGWQLVMDVNLKGTWLMCKHTVPAMRARAVVPS